MANIEQKVAEIRNKIKGKEVRESLASGIEAINIEVVSTTTRQKTVEARQDVVDANEVTRQINETSRVSAEGERVNEFDVIKTEYDTYKNVMISESNVAALQNNININASALLDMSNYLNYMPINGGDFDGQVDENVLIDGGEY